MKPTPETDKFFATFADGEAAPSHAEYYARLQDLERERDEWKALATQYSGEREHNAMQALAYKAERDEWESKYIQQNKDLGCEMMDPNGTIWDHAKTLQRERDEARAEMAAIKAMLLDPVEVELDMIRGNIAIPARPEFSGVYDTGKAMANLIRERDEARGQVENQKERIGEFFAALEKLISERDEARGQRDRLAEALEHTIKHMRHRLNCPARLAGGIHACNCQMEWAYDNATEALQSLTPNAESTRAENKP